MLCEGHAFGSEPVDMRRAKPRLPKRTQVAIAEIVGEDDDDVGFFGDSGRLSLALRAIARDGEQEQTQEAGGAGKKHGLERMRKGAASRIRRAEKLFLQDTQTAQE